MIYVYCIYATLLQIVIIIAIAGSFLFFIYCSNTKLEIVDIYVYINIYIYIDCIYSCICISLLLFSLSFYWGRRKKRHKHLLNKKTGNNNSLKFSLKHNTEQKMYLSFYMLYNIFCFCIFLSICFNRLPYTCIHTNTCMHVCKCRFSFFLVFFFFSFDCLRIVVVCVFFFAF